MDQNEIYIMLLGIIILVGLLFNKSTIPIALILVLTGIGLSLFISFPHIELNPNIVLDIFLPMLLYEISGFSSWNDIKKNMRPIMLLSIGHVLFITFLVALAIHTLIPQLGWPLAILLGAVLSPPDDVAIVSIAEKIHMPKRLLTILEGEGMLNDATALILFRFALAAVVTHEFSILQGVSQFCIVIALETLYGIALAYAVGTIRLKIDDPILHMIISIVTPFLAYFPAERLGGCGVLATVVTGFVMGHHFLVRFPPEVRLASRFVWPTLTFVLQNFLFLLVGLNMRFILDNLEQFPSEHLVQYTIVIVSIVIIGRFLWVYPSAYIPRFFFASIRRKDPYPPWQYPFIISWAGMRGGISLAAALAVPVLPGTDGLENPRDFVIFLVFCVIIITLIVQGLTLPFILRALGIHSHIKREQSREYFSELSARIKMATAVIQWLYEYKESVIHDEKLLEEVKLQIRNYRLLKKQLRERIDSHAKNLKQSTNIDSFNAFTLLSQIIEVEKNELFSLWQKEEISHAVRNKLLDQLDHRAHNLVGNG